MVVSILALVVALGGTSYAAVVLPKNSVGSKQVRARGITASDLAGNAVTSSKIRDGSMLAKDFKAGQLVAGARGSTGAAGPRGATGARGATGENGADGADGAAGATNVVSRVSAAAPVGPAGSTDAMASCLPGERATGGGGWSGNALTVPIVSGVPANGAGAPVGNGTMATQWIATGVNNGGSPSFVQAFVICSAP